MLLKRHKNVCCKECFNIMGLYFNNQLKEWVFQASSSKMKLLWSHRFSYKAKFRRHCSVGFFCFVLPEGKKRRIRTYVSAKVTSIVLAQSAPKPQGSVFKLDRLWEVRWIKFSLKDLKNKAWNLLACGQKKRDLFTWVRTVQSRTLKKAWVNSPRRKWKIIKQTAP